MNVFALDPTENDSLICELISVREGLERYKEYSCPLSLHEQIAEGRRVDEEERVGSRSSQEFSDEEVLLQLVYLFYKDEAEAVLKSERSGILSACTQEFRKTYNSTVREFGFYHKFYLQFIENLRNVLTKPDGSANKNGLKSTAQKLLKTERKSSLSKDEITKINNKRRMMNILFSCRCKTLRCKHMVRDSFNKDKFDLRKSILRRKFQSNFASGMCVRNGIAVIYDEQFRQLFKRTIEVYHIYSWVLLRFAKRVPRCVIGVTPIRHRKKKSGLLPIVKKRELQLGDKWLRKGFQDQFKF